MKRKIFSKLLMVALVIAAVGSFVSCKDYDDDINNLQKQIDNAALKSSVEALQSTLDSKIAAAQSAAQAAQTAADKAATTANAAVTKTQLDDAIAAAKTAAQTAAQTYADQVATAAKTDAAKDAYDQAKAYTDAEVAKVTAAIPSEDAIKAIADAAAAELDEKLATDLKAWVNEQIAAIDVEGQVDAAVAKAIEKIDTAAANVAAIWSAVTSIEFVIGNNNVWNNTQFLNFQYGEEKANVFGNATELHAYKAADEYKTYTAGADIKAENVYLVRVSPVTADLTTAGVKLMNSKGENLDAYVDIAAKKYDDILTRAGETGLWKLTVTLKKGVDIEKLQEATHAIVKNNVTTSAAVYAFAVNNSEAAAADRYAVTAYDLKPLVNEYTPTSTLNFNVNGIAVGNIHNRWQGDYVEAEDETIARDEANWELKWVANAAKGVTVPDTKIIAKGGSDSKTANYGVDTPGDVRIAFDPLAVKVGEPIIINFNAADYMFVDRYYVLYDKDNAIESQPSEWNSWNEYDVTGLAEMKKSTERLVITINDKKAEGDILGFRLYAVNYDGTLVDPDGKAFYVQVGSLTGDNDVVVPGTFNVNEAAATFTASAYTTEQLISNKKNSVIVKYNFRDLGYADAITLARANFPFAVQASVANNKPTAAAPINVNVTYLTSDQLNALGKKQEATTVNKVEYILLTVLNPEQVVDGASIITTPVYVTNPDDHDKNVARLSFYLTKGTIAGTTKWGDNLPAWKSGYTPANGVVTLYPGIDEAAGYWAVDHSADDIDVDLTKYTNNLLSSTAADNAALALTIKKNGTKLGAAAAAAYYDKTTGAFTIPADEIGQDAREGVTFNSYAVTLTANATEQLSRKYADDATAAQKQDAAANSTLAATKTDIFNYTLNFANIWDYQTYTTEYTYRDGKIGEAIATKYTDKKSDKLCLKYSTMAAGTRYALAYAYNNAVPDAGPTNWADVAKIEYKSITYAASTAFKTLGATAGTIVPLIGGAGAAAGDLLNVTENTALATFNAPAWLGNYVSFGAVTSTDDAPVVLTAATGAINEYVEYYDSNQISANVIAFQKVAGATATLPTPTVDMIFQFTAVDAFGGKHKIQIPFTLAQ